MHNSFENFDLSYCLSVALARNSNTQEELAKFIGINQSNINSWINNKRAIPLHRLNQILNFLDMNLITFLSLDKRQILRKI